MEKKKKNSFITINLFVIVTVFIISMMLSFFTNIEKGTEDYVEVEVTIDDISFEPNGSRKDSDSDTTYYLFKMNRILHFTYNGKDYDIEDTKAYESTNRNYEIELQKNYHDGGLYKIDPDNPRSHFVSYVDMSVVYNIVKIGYIVIGVCIAGLIVYDSVVIYLKRKAKKEIFD